MIFDNINPQLNTYILNKLMFTLGFQIQVGFAGNKTTPSDVNCWQRPEDMEYERPASSCDSSAASDLAGEIVAALSAASLVFKEDIDYSGKLIKTAEKLFDLASRKDPSQQGTYTRLEDCGKEARNFYNSSGYLDELVWGGTWLFFATGNTSHLNYATQMFTLAQNNETNLDKGLFYWNNKLTANAVRNFYFHIILLKDFSLSCYSSIHNNYISTNDDT